MRFFHLTKNITLVIIYFFSFIFFFRNFQSHLSLFDANTHSLTINHNICRIPEHFDSFCGLPFRAIFSVIGLCETAYRWNIGSRIWTMKWHSWLNWEIRKKGSLLMKKFSAKATRYLVYLWYKRYVTCKEIR